MEEKIINVLRASGRPMRALDIARAIPGCEKRDVNRVIHRMRDVEISNPGMNPPLWQLYTGSIPTTTPQPLRPQAQQITTANSTSSISSSQGTMGQGENVTRVSDNPASLADQVSRISIGDSGSATWDDKLLATVEKTQDGAFVIQPIPREAIINRGMGDREADHEDSAQGQLPHPVQETCSNEGKEVTSSLPKVNPINLSSGHEMMKEVDKERSENKAKRKEYSSQVFDHTLQATRRSYSEATRSTTVPQQSSLSPTDSKTKKKPKIAANFSGLCASSTLTPKQQILEILGNETQPLATFTIAQRLGHSTRLEAMGLLEELKREGRVSEVVRNEVSHWSIRE